MEPKSTDWIYVTLTTFAIAFLLMVRGFTTLVTVALTLGIVTREVLQPAIAKLDNYLHRIGLWVSY